MVFIPIDLFWVGTHFLSELASRSCTRENECDLQVLSELGSHSSTLFNVCSSYGVRDIAYCLIFEQGYQRSNS